MSMKNGHPDLSSARIFIVDDELTNIKLLDKTLSINGYTNIVPLQDPREVITRYTEQRPDLILLDLNMPYLSGFDVLDRLKELNDPLLPPVLVLTAQKGREFLLEALKKGARDYLTKPFDITELAARVRNMLEVHNAHKIVHEQKDTLDEMVRERTNELLQTRLQVVQKLGRAAEYRDNETGQHIMRVSHMAVLLAENFGWCEADSETLLHATPMHDIGKIGIPDKILLKPGKLDLDEWTIMKTHTTIGAHILDGDDSDLLRLGREIALTHHEKWDGTGYPSGLREEEIPLSGRIAALVDVFDALTSDRPYKKAWKIDDALALLRENRGSHFDPDLVDLFNKHLPEILRIQHEFLET